MKIVILDGYPLNPGDLDWEPLKKLGDCEIFDRTTPDQLMTRATGADILLTNKVILNQNIINQLPDLKYIGVLATGYNVVDVMAAKDKGIIVTNVPAYSTPSVAQHAFALLLELTNSVGIHNTAVSSGEWCDCLDYSFTKTPLIELQNKTFGVFGYGTIGKAAANIALAFGMKVLAHSRNMPNSIPEGIEWTSDKNRIFTESDVISLHCPLTNETENIICADTIAMMKASSLLINTSRGTLINEADLSFALKNGLIAGAAVDVLSAEPALSSNPLLTAPNCIITPHIAWASSAARKRLLKTVIENIIAFQSGNKQNVVN